MNSESFSYIYGLKLEDKVLQKNNNQLNVINEENNLILQAENSLRVI